MKKTIKNTMPCTPCQLARVQTLIYKLKAKELGYWFSMPNGAHVFVKEGQTRGQAIGEKFGDKAKKEYRETKYAEVREQMAQQRKEEAAEKLKREKILQENIEKQEKYKARWDNTDDVDDAGASFKDGVFEAGAEGKEYAKTRYEKTKYEIQIKKLYKAHKEAEDAGNTDEAESITQEMKKIYDEEFENADYFYRGTTPKEIKNGTDGIVAVSTKVGTANGFGSTLIKIKNSDLDVAKAKDRPYEGGDSRAAHPTHFYSLSEGRLPGGFKYPKGSTVYVNLKGETGLLGDGDIEYVRENLKDYRLVFY